MSAIQSLLLYCRSGFENECAAEIQAQASHHELFGYCKTQPGQGFVQYILHQPTTEQQSDRLPFRTLIFARQCIAVFAQLDGLPVTDRVKPIVEALNGGRFSDCLLETADTNEAKSLSSFLRQFDRPLRQALNKAGLLAQDTRFPRLHLFFLNSTSLFLGLSHAGNAAPWPMGIPRLRFPSQAPSRSTLKLEEAIHWFLPGEQQTRLLCNGMTAVDLGAAPGGWTWQLVQRGIRVTAVDNGPMDGRLMESGLVDHLRADGFSFHPRRPVDWLVCDMVEQPARIARLVAQWLERGDCRHAIFNLKLPMKKRYAEVLHCLELVSTPLNQAGRGYQLACKQLYHDREEVTVFISLDD